MATIYIDNRPYQVKDGQNLLAACLSLGLDLPYFCWHPAMHSVGACRQCAVKQFRDASDAHGRIVMACMTPAAHGTRISIDDPEARAFRAGIVELLMVKHPHDCPVCDEGGECHLQDMTVMTGHAYRHFRFPKRTYRDQDLGPFLNHEMNRCIQCYRCVRFYRDFAGGRDLEVLGWHDHVYFGRHEDGPLESEFSGNLVEVCPTGVFTDKTLKRHYTRKWDLQTAPSVCVHCGLGCNTIPGERYGTLRRIRSRYNGQVNGYFLCDRGRYGYEFVNSPARIRQPLRRLGEAGKLEGVSKAAALECLGGLLREPGRAIGIGSPRASLEANFALRCLVGPDRFCLGLSQRDSRLLFSVLRILRTGPARTPTLREVEQADAALVLGEDVTNTAPMLAYALRQSARRKPMELAPKLDIPEWNDAAVRELIQDEKGPLFIASCDATRLDDAAAGVCRAAPDDIARLGFAVAHALDPRSHEPGGLSDEVRGRAQTIARALREAQRPLVVSGTSSGSEPTIQAAANVAWALSATGRNAGLCYTLPECNSLGLALMGGVSLEDAAQALRDAKADTVVILENDLYRRTDADFVNAMLASAKHVVAIDHLMNATTAKAEVVLPAATFAESSGTLVNNEGRAQRFWGVFVPPGDIQESWRWLRDAMIAAGRDQAGAWRGLDDILAAMAKAMPVFAPLPQIAPPAGFRAAGQKIPRQPHRYSGRTAMLANIDVSEPQPPDDGDAPLAFSMEGFTGMPPSALLSNVWAPSWNSVQAINKFQSEVGGPLHGGDPGRRLIEPAQGEKVACFDAPPDAFQPREGQWWVVPAHHVFGSEELSVLSPGIAQRSPKPYLGLNPGDAARLGVTDGQEVQLSIAGAAYRLPVKSRPALPPGLAALPVGLPDVPAIALPAWGKVHPAGGGKRS